MKIYIHYPFKSNKDEIIDLIQKRLNFSLGRFSSRIKRLRFQLKDINGPKGGIDKRCSLLIQFDMGKELFIESTESTPEVAIDILCDKASRAVARFLESLRAFRFESGMVPKNL